MSSLAPRRVVASLLRGSYHESTSTSTTTRAAAVAGPSYTTGPYAHHRHFSVTGNVGQAVAVGPETTSFVLPLKKAVVASEEAAGGILSRHFSPRHSIPPMGSLPARFLLKISTPLPTTSVHCTGGPQILVHDASRDLYFTHKLAEQGSSAEEKAEFKRLTQEVRKGGSWARVFWAERVEGQEAVRVLVEEPVDAEAVKQAEL